MTPKEKRIVYFSFLGLGPLTFAVPRRVFCLFLRCLPVVQRVSDVTERRRERPTLLSAGTLGLGGEANTDESVVGLKLLHRLGRVVDEGEASGLATTELCSEAKDADLLLLGLVETGELVAELLLGDVGAAGVEDVPVDAKSAKSHHRLMARLDPSRPVHPNAPRRIGQEQGRRRNSLGPHVGLVVAGNSSAVAVGIGGRTAEVAGKTHTTICLRPSRGLRMNLRVRRVTGESESAIFAMLLLSCKIDDQAGGCVFGGSFCAVWWCILAGCSDWVDL